MKKPLLFALALFASAPAIAQPLPGSGATPPLGVTHENQGNTSWCNYYALAAILRFHHQQNPQNQYRGVLDRRLPPGVAGPPAPGLVTIAATNGWSPNANPGTALPDSGFVRLASYFGYQTVEYTGTFGPDGPAARAAALDRLLSELRAGRPPAIGLLGHAWVVSGVRTNAAGQVTHVLLTHSGPANAGSNQPMPIGQFMNAWAAFDFNMIAVIPPHAPARGLAAGGRGGGGAIGAGMARR